MLFTYSYSSIDMIYFFKQQEVVGITLGIDSNKITCHVKRLGGGFGGKVMKIASLSAIAATAAYKYGKIKLFLIWVTFLEWHVLMYICFYCLYLGMLFTYFCMFNEERSSHTLQ